MTRAKTHSAKGTATCCLFGRAVLKYTLPRLGPLHSRRRVREGKGEASQGMSRQDREGGQTKRERKQREEGRTPWAQRKTRKRQTQLILCASKKALVCSAVQCTAAAEGERERHTHRRRKKAAVPPLPSAHLCGQFEFRIVVLAAEYSSQGAGLGSVTCTARERGEEGRDGVSMECGVVAQALSLCLCFPHLIRRSRECGP